MFKDKPTKKETLDEKQAFLNLQALTLDGKLINIEVQLRKEEFFPKRSVYYTSKLVTGDFETKMFRKYSLLIFWISYYSLTSILLLPISLVTKKQKKLSSKKHRNTISSKCLK
ncbi:PD-(D/E)XK nuclease family transposase [Metabacillus lacus]|uniref:PD-(D/E)XK nuclease family transposase n=1 Tax=Metabacillus lacus TaxID=1983721 RepID=UPI0014784D83